MSHRSTASRPGLATAARALVLAVAAGTVAPVPALAAPPTELFGAVLPAPVPSGITLDLQSFATLPRHADGSSARPQFLCPAPGWMGGLFVTDEAGVIFRVSADGSRVTPYLDLRAQPISFISPTSEEGLVGLAFHPNFAGSPSLPGYGKFYTAFSADRSSGTPDFLANDAADHHQVIREWTATDPMAAMFSGTSREVLRVGKYASNHNGGVIRFDQNAKPGFRDYGNLYIGFGDGGGGNDPRGNGQNLTSPLGKILRIDPLAGSGGAKYTVPTDNPFRSLGGAAPLVWAYGLRNPQQFSFETGRLDRMFIDDIGQNQVEEVNLGARGANYGWQQREGSFATGVAVGSAGGKDDYGVYPLAGSDVAAGFTDPIAEYDHSDTARDGGTVAAGAGSGFAYGGTRLPALRGAYVFADFVQGRLFAIPTATLPIPVRQISSIALSYQGVSYDSLSTSPVGEGDRSDLRLGTDSSGELYALLKGPGAIYRIVSHP